MLKGHLVKITMPLYGNFDSIRQCIDHGNPYTMQTTGKLVVIGAEFPAGMKLGQDNFNPTLTIFRMDIDRHATTIIFYRQRTIFIDRHGNFIGMSCKCLIHCIINYFLCQMVWTSGIGIHAGTTTYRI